MLVEVSHLNKANSVIQLRVKSLPHSSLWPQWKRLEMLQPSDAMTPFFFFFLP